MESSEFLNFFNKIFFLFKITCFARPDSFIILSKYISSSPKVSKVLYIRSLISLAALFVKVRVNISLGFASSNNKEMYRTVNAKVFPEPALAFRAKNCFINVFYSKTN